MSHDFDPGQLSDTSLEAYRKYLLGIAGAEMDNDLQRKFAPSDVVQETLIEAVRDKGQFRGRSEPELRGWLRGILRHNIANSRRHYRDVQKRSLGKEVGGGDASAMEEALSAAASESATPSGIAQKAESAQRLLKALRQLSDEHQKVIHLKNWELASFKEIGEAMGRTPDAARMLWVRAVELLANHLGPIDDL